MKALITGASRGLGKDMAIYLSKLGHDVILVARNKKDLYNVKKEIKTNCKIIVLDLSNTKNIYSLYNLVSKEEVDILINNAGFGLFGEFGNTDILKEDEMINLNIKAVHILTKLFLKDMLEKNKGYILNVSSAAAYMPGPLMSTYYATKSYVHKMSLAVYQELEEKKSNVNISVLCPGPVETNFNEVANVSFGIKPLSSEYVAKYAVDKMFAKKIVIIPGFKTKISIFITRFIPVKILLKINYNIQKRKDN